MIFQSQANNFSISGEQFFNLRRTIFQSQANDFIISGERNEAWLKDAWDIFQLIIQRK